MTLSQRKPATSRLFYLSKIIPSKSPADRLAIMGASVNWPSNTGHHLRFTQPGTDQYEGEGRGTLLESAQEYVDHERRARSIEYRMDSAWFGHGAQIKQRALDAALRRAT